MVALELSLLQPVLCNACIRRVIVFVSVEQAKEKMEPWQQLALEAASCAVRSKLFALQSLRAQFGVSANGESATSIGDPANGESATPNGESANAVTITNGESANLAANTNDESAASTNGESAGEEEEEDGEERGSGGEAQQQKSKMKKKSKLQWVKVAVKELQRVNGKTKKVSESEVFGFLVGKGCIVPKRTLSRYLSDLPQHSKKRVRKGQDNAPPSASQMAATYAYASRMGF